MLFKEERPSPYKADVFRILLGAPTEELPLVWSAFVEAIHKTDTATICLASSKIETLAQFAKLPGLLGTGIFQVPTSLTFLH